MRDTVNVDHTEVKTNITCVVVEVRKVRGVAGRDREMEEEETTCPLAWQPNTHWDRSKPI